MSDTETTKPAAGGADAAGAAAAAEPDEARDARELAAAERMSTAAAEDLYSGGVRRSAEDGASGTDGEAGADGARAAESAASARPDGEAGEAGAGDSAPVGLGVIGWLRWLWRQLTSMRVALVLLFLLSLAAIPGSLIPQTSANANNVTAFLAKHGTLGPIYQKLGLFHVYSSPWFAAVYILLFVSLAGCIVPRCWQFVKVLRSQPPAAPRHLVRLPVYATWRTATAAEEVLEAAHGLLRRRRFRVGRGTGAAAGSLSSERGYLREVGNLLFHVSLFGLLIAFAVGKLYGGQGDVVVIQGQGFTNTLTQYDDFTPSSFYGAGNLDDFGFTLDSFHATYQTSGPQQGSPTSFVANVHYWKGSDSSKTTAGKIQVNKPLKIGGSNVYLTNHGYAPIVTVKDAKGNVAFSGPTACLQQDSDWTSTCAIKVPDYVGKDGKSTQLGFSGLFGPTMVVDAVRGPHSVFPGLDDPALFLTGYEGDLGIDSGLPQSVYELDTTHMKQFTATDGSPAKQMLTPGKSWTLPNGAGTLTFDGVDQWAQFTVAHNPGTEWALLSAVLAILGLIGSLFVQRRRVWVRALPGPDGTTVVELAGLGRSESARIAEELASFALALQDTAPAEPEPEPSAADDATATATAATAADAEPGAAADAEAPSDSEPGAPAVSGSGPVPSADHPVKE